MFIVGGEMHSEPAGTGGVTQRSVGQLWIRMKFLIVH